MKKLLIFLICMALSATIFAQPIQELVFFGDSITDNGNLYSKLKFIPKSPPYYQGRFSNGPVWAEHLSNYFYQRYGVRSVNYAVGGATAIKRSVWDGFLPYYLKLEINSYLDSNDKTDKANVLYFLWIGANDYMSEKKQTVEALVQDVVDETLAQMKVLIDHGAKNFVFMDLPDITAAPYAKNLKPAEKERLKNISLLHHQKLAAAVDSLKKNYPESRFIYVDAYAIFNDIMANTDYYNKKYHKNLINLTDACWEGGYTLKQDAANEKTVDIAIAEQVAAAYAMGATPCKAPQEYLFWDSIHPSVDMHEMFSSMLAERMNKEFYPV
jgi:phospholipase/lecithinase/hemolysin